MPVLRVDKEFMRQHVQNFAIFGKRNVAGGFDGPANVFAFDVARAMPEGNSAAAIHPANVAAGYADHGGLHRNVGHTFSFFERHGESS